MSDDLTIKPGAYLPKWTLSGSIYHVRFRLADSLPYSRREEIHDQREHLKKRVTNQIIPLTPEESKSLENLFSDRVEQLLDNGAGACYLERPEIAELVQVALRFYNNERYHLHAWCIMPNHVHVVVEPLSSYALSTIVHSWKSFTANKANNLLKRKGAFWSRDYYSRIIRNEREYRAQIQYVWNNPEQINRPDWPWRWIKHV